MIRRQPRFKPTATLCPYTTLFRSRPRACGGGRMKFSDRLGRRPRKPFHSAIATTFAVEFAAVEEIMLPQLMASGATNLLLIADDRMAAMALSVGSRLPNALGRDYALQDRKSIVLGKSVAER